MPSIASVPVPMSMRRSNAAAAPLVSFLDMGPSLLLQRVSALRLHETIPARPSGAPPRRILYCYGALLWCGRGKQAGMTDQLIEWLRAAEGLSVTSGVVLVSVFVVANFF